MPITVLIAENSPESRDELIELFAAADDDFVLVGVANDARSAAAIAARIRPDVAVLDVGIAGGGGASATREILSRTGSTKVLAYSAADDREAVVSMLRSGANSYVLKGTGSDALFEAIRQCARGGSSVSSEVAGHLVAEVQETTEEELLARAEREALLARTRALLVDGAIEPIFQPVVRLADGEVVGWEALSRFPGSDATPEQVFVDAEACGLTGELELRAVCAQVDAFRGARPPAGYLAVNASPELLANADFVEVFAPGPDELRVVEVTERQAVERPELLARAVAVARSRNIRIALDDAGSGYSSLQRILDLHPDIIKLDRALVRGIDVDRSRRALVAGLARFASEVGMFIVAEGIENAEERDVVRALGVDHGQGFFFAPPSAVPTSGRLPATAS